MILAIPTSLGHKPGSRQLSRDRLSNIARTSAVQSVRVTWSAVRYLQIPISAHTVGYMERKSQYTIGTGVRRTRHSERPP
jgi:hypothetical protein